LEQQSSNLVAVKNAGNGNKAMGEFGPALALEKS
jgi:hypothetical protein